ncbi:MAG: hypothetical protein A2W91_16615 [Bacteroidetes bacterium GWF2_38_335]|nr:MAG: hypothetical protein A2W91_16615 [Bacteroidetes bacterium GWF2_38_335]OFY81311.1 MAG: hypothetical protein A2281_07590 [Bacteroidetes bacterium RIFOXYA12_FULL_38_20]HBS85431.1 hypothetical protein [Bacteroidales bacterium]
MNPAFKKFLIKNILLSLFIWTVSAILFLTVLKDWFIPVMNFVFLFCMVLSIVTQKIVLDANKKKTARFVPVFMLSVFVKLMAYIIFIVAYVFSDRENAVPFLILFLLLYFVYTIFEVISILPEARKAQN